MDEDPSGRAMIPPSPPKVVKAEGLQPALRIEAPLGHRGG
jgi:hypothetical protein